MNSTIQKIRRKIFNFVHSFITISKNILFPIECISCQKPDTLLCYTCLSTLHTRLNNTKLASHLEIYAAYGFSIPLIKKLITRGKYYHTPSLFEDLTLHAIPTLSPLLQLHKNKEIILIPVPLHYIRQQHRGFNQSMIIANTLSDSFENTSVIPLVERIKNTPQQAKRNKKERIKNIQNSFRITKKYQDILPTQNNSNTLFIIIDDVISTGSTVVEIQKLLLEKSTISIKNILAISLCRG